MKPHLALRQRSNAELLGILAREDDALRQQVTHLIESNPGRFIADLALFLNLREEHLLLLIRALKAKEATQTLLWDWSRLLTFMEELLSDPTQKTTPQVGWEVGLFLKETLKEARSYGLYVHRRMHPAVKGHQEIWIRLLTLMLQGPAPQATDPTHPPSHEWQDMAFDALLKLGFTLQHDLSKAEPPKAFQLRDHPELERVFWQVLQAPFLHARIGQSIHLLEHLDWVWLLDHQQEVFPDDDPERFQVTLQAYLKEAHLSGRQVEHLKVFPTLLDRLVKGGWRNENQALLSNLVDLMKFGELEVSSWVIQKVFNEGPMELRFEFLRQLGRKLVSREHDEWVDHALALWEWRKKQVLAGQAEAEELEAFESWLHAMIHTNQKLTELLFVLTHTSELKHLCPEIILMYLTYHLDWEPLLATQVLKALAERHTLPLDLRQKVLHLLKQALGFRASKNLAEQTLGDLFRQGWDEKLTPATENEPASGDA